METYYYIIDGPEELGKFIAKNDSSAIKTILKMFESYRIVELFKYADNLITINDNPFITILERQKS